MPGPSLASSWLFMVKSIRAAHTEPVQYFHSPIISWNIIQRSDRCYLYAYLHTAILPFSIKNNFLVWCFPQYQKFPLIVSETTLGSMGHNLVSFLNPLSLYFRLSGYFAITRQFLFVTIKDMMLVQQEIPLVLCTRRLYLYVLLHYGVSILYHKFVTIYTDLYMRCAPSACHSIRFHFVIALFTLLNVFRYGNFKCPLSLETCLWTQGDNCPSLS